MNKLSSLTTACCRFFVRAGGVLVMEAAAAAAVDDMVSHAPYVPACGGMLSAVMGQDVQDAPLSLGLSSVPCLCCALCFLKRNVFFF